MEPTAHAAHARPGLPDPAELPRPWLEHYPPGVPPTYDYPRVPVTRLLDDAARDFPDTDATVHGRASMSYAELLDAVDRFATALSHRGVGHGTRVAIVAPNLPAVPITVFAVLRLAAVVVHIDPDTSAQELGRRLRTSGAEVVVADATSLPDVNAVRSHLPRLRHVIATGVEDWLAFPADRLVRLTGRRDGTYRRIVDDDDAVRMHALLDGHDPVVRQAPVNPETLAVIRFSGGTDGGGEMLTHANLLAVAFQARLWIPDVQAGRERVLLAQPLASSYGLGVGLLASVLAAATLVLPRRDDADVVVTTAAREEVTLLHTGARLLEELAWHRGGRRRDLDTLRAGLVVAGATRPEALVAFEARTGARMRAAYGCPEAPISHAAPVYGRVRRGHIGLPVTDTVASILDEDRSRPLPPGEEGILAIHGPQVAAGVLTRQGPVPADGWLVTAARAVMHDGGSFEVTTTGGEA